MALTVERLREVLDYDPETGVFRWKERRGSAAAGSVAGCTAYFGNSNWPAVVMSVDGNRRYAHQLAWLYVYGELPSIQVDHIDGDSLNNRISNLRLATHCQNQQNRRGISRCGVKGVTWCRTSKKWMARIKIDGKTTYLGVRASKEEAGALYEAAARERYGEFARS